MTYPEPHPGSRGLVPDKSSDDSGGAGLSFCFSATLMVFCLFFQVGLCFSQEGSGSAQMPGLWDDDKYISIDEVRPGMDAYCLTVYEGTRIERFDLEVLSVVRNMRPGRDAILVQGTDERFIRTGPVAGCSGSPVYIEGRLAGALAFGWTFSKDALYGVTPVKDMLEVGQQVGRGSPSSHGQPMSFSFDFSKGLDLSEAFKQVISTGIQQQSGLGIAQPLPCPMVVSGMPASAVEQLDSLVRSLGFVAASGTGASASSNKKPDVELAPGSCLGVSLVTGDFTLDVIGTVTEVVDDKVFGFGHHFLGYGPVDLPMSTGQVHTVVSSVVRSFKFATSLEVVGAFRADESAAIYGEVGAEARMFPLKITMDRYNDSIERIYNCGVADNRRLTAILLYISLVATAQMRGSLPPDHLIEYKVNIETEQTEPIVFENVSSGKQLSELVVEGVAPVAILMNNPYGKVDIKSVDYHVRILPTNAASHIWSVDLVNSKVKAGKKVEVSAVIESYMGAKKRYDSSFMIPENTPPGTYQLIVSGGYGYLDFLRQKVPYRFVPENLATLVEAMNDVLEIQRDKLYFMLVLPAGGVTLERSELPDLPATKAMVLQDPKRTLRARPYSRWLEKSYDVGTIVAGRKVAQITVEE